MNTNNNGANFSRNPWVRGAVIVAGTAGVLVVGFPGGLFLLWATDAGGTAGDGDRHTRRAADLYAQPAAVGNAARTANRPTYRFSCATAADSSAGTRCHAAACAPEPASRHGLPCPQLRPSEHPTLAHLDQRARQSAACADRPRRPL